MKKLILLTSVAILCLLNVSESSAGDAINCKTGQQSCKDMGGYCNRIQYTPAEAAQVLRDGDKNEIVITFKK